MEKTRIIIVDDHMVVIEGIKSALQEHHEFEVIGVAQDGSKAVALAEELKPDIVIMDVSIPKLNGVEASRRIKRNNPDIRIVIYTMYSEKELVIELFKCGISAYVLKEDPLSDLILALQVVREGGTYFSTKTPTILLTHLQELEEKTKDTDLYDTLSNREREVFILLAQGMSVKEIAGELFISPKTVESHKYNIMQKLKAESVVDLTKIAIRKKLIEL